MSKRGIASLALLSLLAFAPGALAGQDKPTPYAPVVSRILSDRALQRFKAVCPADLAERLTTRRLNVSLASKPDCGKDPAACLKACGERDGAACMGLAHALEDAKPSVTYEAIKPLFAVACALGDASGCTNRAAALRDIDGDDPLDHEAETAESCEFRSFAYACSQDDAWGCAMLGQAQLHGEGVTRNVALARAMLAKSCSLAPQHEACRFATRLAQDAD